MEYQYSRVSGTVAGTAVVKSTGYGILHSVTSGLAKTGTATFYDNASGTSASSLLFALNNNAISNHVLDIRLKNGLTVETGGTTDLLVSFN